jgi:hypothetical protein
MHRRRTRRSARSEISGKREASLSGNRARSTRPLHATYADVQNTSTPLSVRGRCRNRPACRSIVTARETPWGSSRSTRSPLSWRR